MKVCDSRIGVLCHVIQTPSDPGVSDMRHLGHVSPLRESGHRAPGGVISSTPQVISQSILRRLGVFNESDLVS